MSYALICLIRLYWLWPCKRHRRCIFRETCSRHVYRITKRHGFLAGARSLKRRILHCRPGYVITAQSGELGLLFKDGTFVGQQFIRDDLLEKVQSEISLAQRRFNLN